MELSNEQLLVLLVLLVAVAAMLVIAPTLRVPYPIVLVLGGLALGFVPGMPELELPPDLVLVAVLPPLLYAGTFFTSLHELKVNMRPIGLLSVGLVIVTTRRRGRRRPRRDRRSRLELGVRARRHRLADRSDRRDGRSRAASASRDGW